jgi:hypothetical protein
MEWFVEPGARVEQFDKICEVQSDKASVEVIGFLLAQSFRLDLARVDYISIRRCHNSIALCSR